MPVLQPTANAAGQAAVKVVAMETSSGKESASRENLEGDGKRTISAKNVGVLYSRKDRNKNDSSGRFAGKTRRDTRSVATGISLQRGSGASQRKCEGCFAMRNGSWEEFKDRYRKEEKSSEWTLERIREANEKVARDEIRRLEICGNPKKKHGTSRRNGRSHVVVCLPALQLVPVGGRTTFGGYRRDTESAVTERRSTAVGGVQSVEAKV